MDTPFYLPTPNSVWSSCHYLVWGVLQHRHFDTDWEQQVGHGLNQSDCGTRQLESNCLSQTAWVPNCLSETAWVKLCESNCLSQKSHQPAWVKNNIHFNKFWLQHEANLILTANSCKLMPTWGILTPIEETRCKCQATWGKLRPSWSNLMHIYLNFM